MRVETTFQPKYTGTVAVTAVDVTAPDYGPHELPPPEPGTEGVPTALAGRPPNVSPPNPALPPHHSPDGKPDIRIEVIPSGQIAPSGVIETAFGRGTGVLLSVPVGVVSDSGQWTCRITNLRSWDLVCDARINYPVGRRTVRQTEIPYELLEGASRALLELFDPVLFATGSRITLRFSPEVRNFLKHSSVSVDVPYDSVLSVDSITLTVPLVIQPRRDEYGFPEIRLTTEMEVDWSLIIPVSGGPSKFSFDISLRLRAMAGAIAVEPLVQVREWVNDGSRFQWYKTTVAERVEAALLGGLEDAAKDLGRYLTEGIKQLAARSDVLHDLTATASAFVVHHYAPATGIYAIPGPFPPLPLPAPTELPALSEAEVQAQERLGKIDHIVVLMMENRSFDHMLGYHAFPTSLLEPTTRLPSIEGLTGKEVNAGVVRVAPLTDMAPVSPPHEFAPVMAQIAEGAMSGFVESFAVPWPTHDPSIVMGYYLKGQLPMYDYFVREFMVCDHWFCAHPGPTWPNRFATLSGRIPDVDSFDADDHRIGYVPLPTVFDRLADEGVSWAYYEHDVAFLRFYDRYRLDVKNIRPVDEFLQRARTGRLPSVSFVDPNFVDVPPVRTANDDHPPADVRHGQALVSCLFDALRSNPQAWAKTLFVITYDEHGGFYDHVPPPGTKASRTTVPIPKLHPNGPRFLGPRVPSFVISPWVPRGSVCRTVLDHTCIAKTILLRFAPERRASLGERVLQSPSLGGLLTEATPRLVSPSLPAGYPKCDGVTSYRGMPSEVEQDPVRRVAGPKEFHTAIARFGMPIGRGG
jgi:phospholipase C